MVDRNGTRYLAFTDRDKSLFKWNTTQRKFVPCAGIVKSFVNVTETNFGAGEGNGPGYDKIYYTWHDSNNDGTWMLNTREPDLQELAVVTTPDSRSGGNWSCKCVIFDRHTFGRMPVWLTLAFCGRQLLHRSDAG